MSRYVIVDLALGLVVNAVLWDGDETQWQPDPGQIAIESETVDTGWLYADGKFTAPVVVPPVASPEEIRASNTAARDQLLGQATLAIDPLQDAVDLEDATVAEIALLKQWKQYRVAVNRIDLTLPDPVWPTQP
jgi:hypothetical protein